jgi:excisionase family DNA binding protein
VSTVEVIRMIEHTTSRHLTVADICAELGISKSTFYDWRAARKAPCCIKLPNGGLRIRRTDLERWLESREGQ